MKLFCSCGNIEVDWNSRLSSHLARRCDCSYCTLANAEYVSDSDSLVRFRINNEAQHQVVQNGTSTAEFHECLSCGLALVTAQIGEGLYAVLNSKVLGIPISHLDVEVNNFSDESIYERMARREKNWCRAINRTA